MLTSEDLEKLAELMRQHHQQCPLGLNQEAAAMINALAAAWKTGKKAAVGTIATMIVTAVIGLIIAGFVEKFRTWIK